MGGPSTWSTDPDTNQSVDPDAAFPEGQAPPTLNNGIRGLMAGSKKYALDQACAGTALKGGSNAYTLSTNQGLTAAAVNTPHAVSFFTDAVNTGPATLSIDGRTARSLRGQGNRQLGGGELLPGILYRAVYTPTLGVYTLTVEGVRPRFEAHKNGVDQAISPGSPAKITFPTELTDLGGWYDPPTSSLKPTVACCMMIGACIHQSAGSEDNGLIELSLYKSGVLTKRVSQPGSAAIFMSAQIEALIEFNGTTDYLEVYATSYGTTQKTIDGSPARTCFYGYMI